SSVASVVTRKELSLKGRSRSGTVSTVAQREDKSGGMWGWAKKAQTIEMQISPETNIATSKEHDAKGGLRKEKSRSRLRGKGRRGELSLAFVGDADENVDSPPPVPSTPASFLTNPSPAMSSSSFLSPASYPSRMTIDPEGTAAGTKSNKSTWKRGMDKIFRSKSSAALREAFVGQENQRHPLPYAQSSLTDLPHSNKQPLGKPFSSSTPPMPFREARRDNIYSHHASDLLSPPPTARSDSFHLTSHPSLPHDPFASSLDLTSNYVQASTTSLSSPNLGSPIQSPRPILSKNSPSLRDLRSLLPRPSKPSLSKAKSMANVREDKVPASAPADRTEFFPSNRLTKRMSSVVGLSAWARPDPDAENAVTRRPQFNRMPTESPPLLPPNPPYFPASSNTTQRSPSPSSNNGSSFTDFSTNETQDLTTPNSAPSTPLKVASTSSPLMPASPSTPHLGIAAPMQRTASGAVLLPRSRSTSMSLKSPPTSSSFFDLYEQLGIWPTPEKDKKPLDVSAKESAQDGRQQHALVGVPVNVTPSSSQTQIHESRSASFSIHSWEAAIGAFPMVESLPGDTQTISKLDFGGPTVGEFEVIEAVNGSPVIDDAASEVLGNTEDASAHRGGQQGMTSSRTAMTGTGQETTHAAPSGAQSLGRAGSLDLSWHNMGSGGSSRNSSRTRRARDSTRQHQERGRWVGHGSSSGSSSGSDDSDNDLDDVPLAQLHPQAAATQVDAQRRKERRRAEKAELRSRRGRPKVRGRNPGAECNWDGEGGVPADVLRRKLEKAILISSDGRLDLSLSSAAASVTRGRTQTEQIPRRTGLGPQPALRPQRSFTDPIDDPKLRELSNKGVQRSQTLQRPRSSGRSGSSGQPVAPTLVSAPPIGIVKPSSRPLSPAIALSQRQSSLRRSNDPGQMEVAPSRPGPSSQTSTAPLSSHIHSRFPPLPAAPIMTKTNDVSRRNTSATERSISSRQRGRALSNAVSSQRPHVDDNARVRSTTEPFVLGRERTTLSVNAFIGSPHGRKVVLDIQAGTTARDVLHTTLQRGDLTATGSSMSWVVVEVFAERGCERQTISANVQLVGAFVHYETKKGKWSKRWLETRGGQVFLAKNEKNKDEIQINTLFHDVYTVTRSYDSPKPFVFVLKRMEPASAFENPEDYNHVFSCEELSGLSLAAAIYDARSYTLAQTQPQILGGSSESGQPRLPTMKPVENGPLVSMEKEKEVEKSAFTGRGLLKV
ncbi:MAG: hypothetical protein TREMPRED_005734, partial [Tremellales sp. Tagirdzhanova-0007]